MFILLLLCFHADTQIKLKGECIGYDFGGYLTKQAAWQTYAYMLHTVGAKRPATDDLEAPFLVT